MTSGNQRELAAKRFGPLSVPQLTEVQAAWLAALIDGEGTVGVWRARRANGAYKYNGIVQISNSCGALLAKVDECLPSLGTITLHNPKRARERGHKPMFVWRLKNRAARDVLEQVVPYLIVKRQQAYLVMRFYDVVHSMPVTVTDHEAYEEFYMQSKTLNRRGTG